VISGIEQLSYDSRGNYTIIISGSGFIDAGPYMYCIYKDNSNVVFRSKALYINGSSISCKTPAGSNNLNVFITYGDSEMNTGHMVSFSDIPEVRQLVPTFLKLPNDVDVITAVTAVSQFNTKCRAFDNSYLVHYIGSQQMCSILAINDDFSTVELSYNDKDFSINEVLGYKIDTIISSISPLLVI
jgi:hypothetical protein